MKYLIFTQSAQKNINFFLFLFFSILASAFLILSVSAFSELQDSDDIIVIEQDGNSNFLIPIEGGSSSLFFGDNLQHFLQFDDAKNSFVFSDDVDFGGNEIINFRLENLAVAPSCNAENNGKAYHNTDTKYSYVCDGSSWNILDNDMDTAAVILPYIYLLQPTQLPIDTTETITITGDNFNPLTQFEFSSGVTVQNIVIENATTAYAVITTGSSPIAVTVTALNENQSWTGNTLTFNVIESLSIDAIADNFADNAATLGQWVPNLYAIRYDTGYDGDRIIDGGNDMYDDGNFINTNLQNNISYTAGALISDDNIFGVNGRYFTSVQNNIFFLSANIGTNITDFFITGNLGADGRGLTDTLQFNYGGYSAYVKRVYGAGSDPSVNHIFLVKEGGTLVHTADTNTDNDTDRISGLETLLNENDEAPFYYMLFAAEQGEFITDDTMKNIVTYTVENILQ